MPGDQIASLEAFGVAEVRFQPDLDLLESQEAFGLLEIRFADAVTTSTVNVAGIVSQENLGLPLCVRVMRHGHKH